MGHVFERHRIGIKATSTQKKNLPFDARGNTVSRMEIKAIGTIVSNRGDGQTVEVEWDTQFKPKDWYFFTYQPTIWRLRRDADYENKELAREANRLCLAGRQTGLRMVLQEVVGLWQSCHPRKRATTLCRKAPYGIEDIIAAGVFLRSKN